MIALPLDLRKQRNDHKPGSIDCAHPHPVSGLNGQGGGGAHHGSEHSQKEKCCLRVGGVGEKANGKGLAIGLIFSFALNFGWITRNGRLGAQQIDCQITDIKRADDSRSIHQNGAGMHQCTNTEDRIYHMNRYACAYAQCRINSGSSAVPHTLTDGDGKVRAWSHYRQKMNQCQRKKFLNVRSHLLNSKNLLNMPRPCPPIKLEMPGLHEFGRFCQGVCSSAFTSAMLAALSPPDRACRRT